MTPQMKERLEKFETPTFDEFVSYLAYRADAQKKYADECEAKGYECYAIDLREDTEMMEIAVDLLKQR